MIWNSIPQDLRKLSRSHFKNKMRHYLLQILEQEEDYVGIPTIMSHLQKIIQARLQRIHYRLKLQDMIAISLSTEYTLTM